MEYRSGGIKSLKSVLNIQCIENVRRIANRKMGAVCVVRCITRLAGCDDIRILLFVVFCQTVGRGLCRCCLQVVEISVLFLVHHQSVTHMVQHFFCKILRLHMSKVFAKPFCIESDFVHTDHTDRGKMICKSSEVTFCIRIQSFIQQFGDHISFDLQGTGGNIHHTIQSLIEILFCLGQVSDSRKVDRHNAHTSGTLSGTEESAALLTQFTQIQTQTTAHTSYIARLHIAVDIV